MVNAIFFLYNDFGDNMKLTILGSSDMWSKNNSASYLIDDDIVVDMPNGACRSLRQNDIDPNKIKHVLITHFHGDHYFDVPFLLLGKTISKEKSDKKVNIYCDGGGSKKISKLTRLAFPHSIKICTELKIKNIIKTKFKINDYIIQKILVDHYLMKPAFGYIISSKNKKVGFTGDTVLCDNVETMASMCDYLICDTTRICGNYKHMGIDNIEYLAEKYPKCIFITSHMNDKTREKLKKTKKKNIIIAKDQMQIEI